MKLIKIALAAVVAVALLLAFLLSTERDRLQREVEAWRTRLVETDEQRVLAEKRLDEAAAEVNRLRSGQEELLKLRAEVGALRGEVRELRRHAEDVAKVSKVQRANQSAPAPEPLRAPEPVASALGRTLADMGATTPEQAVTTFMWAATNGRLEKMAELVETPEHLRDDQLPRLYELISNRMSNQVATLDFLDINKIQPKEDGTLSMQLLYRDRESGKTNPFNIYWRQHDQKWKIVFNGVPKDF